MHYIRYDVLYAYVLSRLQYWSQQAQQDEDKLLKRLLNASDKERSSAKKKQASELKKAEKCKAEVDGLFAKMYEDWSAGRITEYNFNMLSEKYQGEQKELDEKIRQLHEAIEAAAQTAVDAEKWVGMIKQYANPTELTAEFLSTLIEKILVHEAVKGEDGRRETGETVPDINNCIALAELYGVSLDDLVNHSEHKEGIGIQPKGKHVFGLVKVGERGQIVIPKKAREIFSISPGERLFVLGDEAQGIALVKYDKLMHFVEAVYKAEECKEE